EVGGTAPEAGSKAAPDDSITIILATGNVELPDLVGMDLEKAQGVLSDLGLTASITKQEDEGDPGLVLKQQPEPGTVGGDTVVELVVSIPKPDPTETPSDEPSESPSENPSETPSGDKTDGGGNGGQDSNGGGDAGGGGGNGGGGNGGTTGTNGGGQADSDDGPLG